jgi:hypothetical protein
MKPTYFIINNLNIVAKIEDDVSYIYDQTKGWIVDNEHLLMDRIMGHGDHSVFDYDEIEEQEAMNLINSH